MKKFMNGCILKEDYDAIKNFHKKDNPNDKYKGEIYALVFCWQQQATHFNKTIGFFRKRRFLSYFKNNNENQIFYRGIHIPNNSFKYDINKYDFQAVSTDKDIAIKFAYGEDNYFKNKGEETFLVTLTSNMILDVDKYRDMNEKEFILYKPTLLKIEKI